MKESYAFLQQHELRCLAGNAPAEGRRNKISRVATKGAYGAFNQSESLLEALSSGSPSSSTVYIYIYIKDPSMLEFSVEAGLLCVCFRYASEKKELDMQSPNLFTTCVTRAACKPIAAHIRDARGCYPGCLSARATFNEKTPEDPTELVSLNM